MVFPLSHYDALAQVSFVLLPPPPLSFPPSSLSDDTLRQAIADPVRNVAKLWREIDQDIAARSLMRLAVVRGNVDDLVRSMIAREDLCKCFIPWHSSNALLAYICTAFQLPRLCSGRARS